MDIYRFHSQDISNTNAISFADETNIDTTIAISDFKMCNMVADGKEEAETPETPEVPEISEDPKEPEAPSQSTENKQNQSNGSDYNNNVEQNSTGKTTSTIINKAVRVEDKLANVIFDSAVPLVDTLSGNVAEESYDISLCGTDGILTIADFMKLKHRSMILNAFLSDRLAVTINPRNFSQALADLELGMDRDTTIDYGQGFSSVTFTPKNSAKMGYDVTIHLGIGAEHAGKVAYLFAKDLTTGELVCKQTAVINNIGNIAYTTEEYSFIVVLY